MFMFIFLLLSFLLFVYSDVFIYVCGKKYLGSFLKERLARDGKGSHKNLIETTLVMMRMGTDVVGGMTAD